MRDALKIPKQGPVIALDGPAGTGKSTATKRLAERLRFVHVDTGALYRAVAYVLRTQGKWRSGDTEEERVAAEELARSIHLEFRFDSALLPMNRIYANGQDVTDHIRTPENSLAASGVSSLPGVRAALLGLQRRLGCQGRSILEGRDIGTVVFPDADVKFFLTASPEVRAKRRMAELQAQGGDLPSLQELQNQIVTRDQADASRAVAPLKQADDAILVDTTHLDLDAVVELLAKKVHERLGPIS
ncbi:MAG: (d)CMP kinase [Bdellovibrionales bacterium]|nr:(d)CMP kinase [Bdellovibrionales bacterium]